MTAIAAIGWVLGALWGTPPTDAAPMKVTGFHEVQKPVSGVVVVESVGDVCVARRWAL